MRNKLVVSGLLICAIVVYALLKNNGFFFEAELAVYEDRIRKIQVDTDEQVIGNLFTRMHPQQSPYEIGIIAIEDHNPVFAGNPYRVYAVGYYDRDHYPRRLIHIVCRDGSVISTDRDLVSR